MPIRRAVELSVKTLPINALGVLGGYLAPDGLSSNLYDFGKTGATAVLIRTHPGPRSVVSEHPPFEEQAQ